MGIIGYDGEVNLWKTDLDVVKIVKVRNEWRCQKCRNPIRNGSYCFGKGYSKFCIVCGFTVLNNISQELRKLLVYVGVSKKDALKNKEKYLKNNMVENL